MTVGQASEMREVNVAHKGLSVGLAFAMTMLVFSGLVPSVVAEAPVLASVAPSDDLTDATGVVYTVKMTPKDNLLSGDTIAVTFDALYTLAGATATAAVDSANTITDSSGVPSGNTMIVTIGGGFWADDSAGTITISGVTNPGTAKAYTATVTTNDEVSSTAGYNLVPHHDPASVAYTFTPASPTVKSGQTIGVTLALLDDSSPPRTVSTTSYAMSAFRLNFNGAEVLNGDKDTTDISFSGGIATLTLTSFLVGDVTLDFVDQAPLLGITDPGDETLTFTPDHGEATKLGLTVAGAPGVAGGTVAVTVKMLDAADKLVNSGAASTASVTIDTLGTMLGASSPFDLVAGQKTFGVQYTTATSLDLIASSAGVTTASKAISWLHAAASKSTLSVDSASAKVGVTRTVTLSLLDEYGNLASTDTTTSVKLTGLGSAVLDANPKTVSGGTTTFTLNDYTAEQLSLNVETFSVASNLLVTFVHDDAQRVAIVDPPGTTVDSTASITLNLIDQYGNVVTSGGLDDNDVQVSVSSTTGQLNTFTLVPSNGVVTLSLGTTTFQLASTKTDTIAISLNNIDFAGAFNHDDTATQFFNHGAASKVAIDAPDVGTLIGATGASVQATLQDQYGNTVLNGAGTTVDVTVTGDATIAENPARITFGAQGTGSVTIANQKAETVTVAMTNNNLLDISATDSMQFINSDGIKVEFVEPSDGSVDDTIAVTIRALDNQENVAVEGVGSTAAITFTAIHEVGGTPVFISDNGVTTNAAGGYTATLANGIAQLGVLTETPGKVTLTFTGSSPTLTHGPAVDSQFAVGVPAKYVITTVSKTTATLDDVSVTATVQLRDQHNNDVSATATVTLTGTNGATGGVVNIAGGTGTQTITNTKPGAVTLGLANPSVSGATLDANSQTVTFTPGAPTTIEFVDPTGTETIADTASITLKALDQHGNLASTSTAVVKVLASAGVLTPADGIVTISTGEAQISLYSETSGTVDLTLQNVNGNTYTATSTADVDFATGAGSKLVIDSVNSGNALKSGETATVTIRLADDYGNTVPSHPRANQRFNLVASPASGASGVGELTLSNGVATTTFSHTKAGTVALSLTKVDFDGSSVTSAISITAMRDVGIINNDASKVVVKSTTTPATAGETITVTLELLDANNNPVKMGSTAGSDAAVTVTGSATGAGTVDIDPNTAIGTIGIYSTTAETVTVGITNVGLNNFDVTDKEAIVWKDAGGDHFDIVEPTDGTVDASVSVTVRLLDIYDNVVKDTALKTASIDLVSRTQAGVTVATTTINLQGGVGSANVHTTTPQTLDLSLINGPAGTSFGDTADVAFAVGAPNKFDFTAASYAGTVDSPINVGVRIEDQHGNPVTSGAGVEEDVELRLTSTTCGVASNAATVDVSAGVGSASLSRTVPGTLTVCMANVGTGSLAVTESRTIVFAHGAPTEWSLAAAPTTVEVGKTVTVTVKLLDQHGNAATSTNEQVTVTTGNALQADTKYTISSGIEQLEFVSTTAKTVNFGLANLVGKSYTIPSSHSATWTAGTVAKVQFNLNQFQNGVIPATNGVTKSVSLELIDSFGNRATGADTAVVSIDTSAGSSTTAVTLTSGLGTFQIPPASNTVTIAITDLTTYSSATKVNSPSNVVFGPPVATKFAVEVADKVSAGVSTNVLLKLVDDNGLTVQRTSAVELYVNNVFEATVTIGSSGQALQAFSRTAAGAYEFTLKHSGTTDTSLDVAGSQAKDTLNVVNNAPSRVQLDDPTDGTVDAAIPVTLRLFDQYDNPVTDGSGTVDLKAGTTTVGDDVSFGTSGIATVNFAPTTPGDYFLTLSGPTPSGLTLSGGQTVSVAHGALASFKVQAPAKVTPNTSFGVTLTALDQHANTVTGFVGTVSFSSTDAQPAAVLPSDYTFLAGDNGVKVFDGSTSGQVFVLATPDDDAKITASSGGKSGSSADIEVKFTWQLKDGWNLVSVPTDLQSHSISVVFQGLTTVSRIHEYDAGTNSYKNAYFDGTSWSGDLTEIDEGKGYWIKSSGATTIEVLTKLRDPPANPPAFSVQAGWNLISYKTDTYAPQDTVDSYLGSLGTDWSTLYRWNADTSQFQKATRTGTDEFTNVDIGQGYWLYMDASGTLV